MSSKTVEKTVRDDDMMRLFNQMIGTGEPDPDVVVPKFQIILDAMDTTIGVLSSFIRSPCGVIIAQIFPNDMAEVGAFANLCSANRAAALLERNDKMMTDLSALNRNRDDLQKVLTMVNYEYDVSNIGDRWRALEKHPVSQNAVMSLKLMRAALLEEQIRARAADPSLSSHAPSLASRSAGEREKEEKKEKGASNTLLPGHNLEKDHYSSAFIAHSRGDSLQLLSFSKLDFKQILLSERLSASAWKYLLTVLGILYREFHRIVECITQPNVDVEQLGQVIIENIGSIKSQVPGCEKAFGRISESLDLFKSNFGGYYKDYLTGNRNPMCIMESYIQDVAGAGGGDRATVAQFNKIVQFYQKRMKTQGNKDPIMQKMLQKAQEQVGLLETETKKESEPAGETAVAAVAAATAAAKSTP